MRSVIVAGVRTPFGRFQGGLSSLSAVQLGSAVLRETLSRAEVKGEEVDEVIMGMVLQGGQGQIPSRQAARGAGIPWEVPTETINKVCASGLRSVTLADAIIRSGDGEILLAGGMESMSGAPYFLPKVRNGLRMGNGEVVDLMVHDGLTCPFHGVHMAVHGSSVAEEYGISRSEQDRWALRSHLRALHAIDAGLLAEEILPIPVPQKKGEPILISQDEGPRRDTSLEKLSALPPVFTKDGTVTAGNAPGVNDGAAALLLMSEERAKRMGRRPLAKIIAHSEIGTDAPYIATAPALAIRKLLKKTGLTLNEISLIEVNEAFAAVVLTSGKMLEWDEEKVNVNGGAVALGHPIGASGTRILLTLIMELMRRGGGLGIAAICSGTAQGDAVLVEVEG